MSARRYRRLEQDHTDGLTLKEFAATLRAETHQARYTNAELDPYSLYTLAELMDVINRSMSGLDPHDSIRAAALRLARDWARVINKRKTET